MGEGENRSDEISMTNKNEWRSECCKALVEGMGVGDDLMKPIRCLKCKKVNPNVYIHEPEAVKAVSEDDTCSVCHKPLGKVRGTCACYPSHGSWHLTCDPHPDCPHGVDPGGEDVCAECDPCTHEVTHHGRNTL